MEYGYFHVKTDGKKFRIVKTTYGSDLFIRGLNGPLEFNTKEEAEDYIHQNLSMAKWKEA